MENREECTHAADSADKTDLKVLVSETQMDIVKMKSSMKKSCFRTVFMGILMVILLAFVGILLFQLQNTYLTNGRRSKDSYSSASNTPKIISPQKFSSLSDVLNEKGGYINIGMRNDYRLQACQSAEFKRSFPDVDYSFLGYDILKGFPQADHHDPGFTLAIFQGEYPHHSFTADCRYSVPRGLQIIPDVSCDTSFSSKIIRNQADMASSLSVSAEVSGGGWGVKFSASAGYKESSSSMARGEYIFITSQASCNYYYSRLIEDSPPAFDPTFLAWVRKLNKKNDLETYIKFFSIYGTHYLTETNFGARFVKKYKMKTTEYQKQTAKGTNVAVSASYSGFISVGGAFSLDSSQQQSASEFMSSVTSETKSVGAAPPANGDAMTWASSVQENPIPSSYKLSSIENLFTFRYMSALSVDFNKIASNINRFKFQYCEHLKAIGNVDSCVSLQSSINILKTKLAPSYKTIPNIPLKNCEENCIKNSECEAITYCTKCRSSQPDFRKCYMFSSIIKTIGAEKDDSYQSTIYRNTFLQNTAIEGHALIPENSTVTTANLRQCNDFLKKDSRGMAHTYSQLQGDRIKCQLYAWRDIAHFYKKRRSSSKILIHIN